MKLTTFSYGLRYCRPPQKWLLVMKLTFLLFFTGFMSVSASTLAQKVTLNTTGASLKTVLRELRKQSGYDFVVDEQVFDHAKPVTLHLSNTDIKDALNKLFGDEGLAYTIEDRVVTIKEKQPGLPGNIKSALNLDKIDVHGRVVGDDGLPLSGATVQVKNGKNSTITNAKGEFRLHDVDPDAIIEISFVGFEKQELKARTEMGLVTMVQASNPLDAVQVIAYGQTTQRLTVGNISTVTSKEIEEQPVANPLLALEARVPGLFITQQNGFSGGGVIARIQGQNSIANGNDPLYVIDGVPYASQTLPTVTGGPGGILGLSYAVYGGSGGGQGNPLNYINPDDIESIAVLKDADATAIYGSRAANGAILITTKKGKAGQTKVNVRLQQGLGQDTRRLDLLSTQQYIQMRLEALRNDGIASPSSTDYDINGLWDQSRYTDWQKVLVGGSAQYADYNGSISGGSENTQFLVSSTFHRETTVFPGSYSDEKGAVHFNLNNSSIDKKFHFTFSGSYLTDNNQLPLSDFTTTSTILAPDAPALYNANGTLNWQPNSAGTSSWTNPLNVLATTYQNKTNNLIANAVISYQFLPGLDARSSFGYNNNVTNEFSDVPLNYNAPETRATTPRGAYYTYNTTNSWIIEPQLNYQKVIKKGKLNLLLGATIQQTNSNGVDLVGTGYNSDAVLQDIKSASSIRATSSVVSVYKYTALFGRLNYNWADRYILDMTVRRDGSSRFGPQSQFHNFGSVGAGWIFSDEDWLKNQLSFLSFGKLRGSYGTTGNDQIANYAFMNLYNPTSVGVPYQNATGLVPNGLPNPYLQWEETRKLQGGIDLGFLKDRILLTVNYAYDRSSNELLRYALPITTGFGGITENFPAVIQNTEWEVILNTINIKSKDFNWSTNLNITIPQNKVVSFPNIGLSSYATGTNGVIVGQPLGIIKAFHFLGVDPATGKYVFEDSQGNPTSSPSTTTDETQLVNTRPRYYGGLENRISYKSFQLDFLFQFVNELGPSTLAFTNGAAPGSRLYNQPVSVLNRWQTPGDISSIERFNSNSSLVLPWIYAEQSDYGYSSASYVRLKNLSFSWKLPEKWDKKIRLQNARLFVQGQNLLTITKYPGLDPETRAIGLPPLRVLTAGIEIGL